MHILGPNKRRTAKVSDTRVINVFVRGDLSRESFPLLIVYGNGFLWRILLRYTKSHLVRHAGSGGYSVTIVKFIYLGGKFKRAKCSEKPRFARPLPSFFSVFTVLRFANTKRLACGSR